MRFAWTGLLWATALAQPSPPAVWGGLEAGPYAIGYQCYFLADGSRHYGHERHERPILVALWRPAILTSAKPLPYRDYLRPPPLASDPGLRSRLETFLLDTVIDDLFQKKRVDLGPSEQAFLDALLSTSTRARRDAPRAEGRFPVILYHSGAAGSYEDNSVLCEYLASWGYVVMTSAFESADGEHVSNNYGGPQTSWTDMAFLLAHARTLAFADADNVGAFGHSMGAQYLLEWLGRKHPRLNAVVSLDTTLEYTAEDFRGHLQLRRRLGHMNPPRVPVLITASADRKPNFSTWDRYLPCRASAAIGYFNHNDFLLHGSLSREFAGNKASEVRANYERLARTVRAFFDMYLRRQPDAWDHLSAEQRPDFRVTKSVCQPDVPALNGRP